MIRLTWDEYFMALAKLAAMRSGCNSRPTGAIIVKDKRVIATGYNGSLPGQSHCSEKENYCHRRVTGKDDSGENKYQECPSIHAEQNAINQISLLGGISLQGAVIYCTLFPCVHCLKNIASVGIKEVVYEMEYKSDDKQRDKYWYSLMDNYGIRARRFEIGDKVIRDINSNMRYITSYRRMD